MIDGHELVDTLLVMRQRGGNDDLCPELVTVARVYAGAASSEDIQIAAMHLDGCELCRETMETMRQWDAPQHDSEHDSVRVIQIGRTSRRRGLGALIFAAAAVAAVVVVGVWQPNEGDLGSSSSREFLVKGKTDSIAVAVQRGTAHFAAEPGSGLEVGDRLGFFYSAREEGFLILLDVSATAGMTVLFPAGKTTSGAIGVGVERPLPDNGAVERLDGCEWLIGVFSSRPLSVADVRAELQQQLHTQGPGCTYQPQINDARTTWVFEVERDEN